MLLARPALSRPERISQPSRKKVRRLRWVKVKDHIWHVFYHVDFPASAPIYLNPDELRAPEKRNIFPVSFEDLDEQELERLQDKRNTKHEEEEHASDKDVDLTEPDEQQMKARHTAESPACGKGSNSGSQQRGGYETDQVEPRRD
jgi:hypothetical protein